MESARNGEMDLNGKQVREWSRNLTRKERKEREKKQKKKKVEESVGRDRSNRLS